MQIDYPNSLGYFYAIATKFLGFEPWGGEGKTMALAAYGKKNKEIADRLKSAFTLNGAFYDVSHFMHNHNAGFLMMNEDELIHELEALLGFSAREKDASITDEHIDFAWFVQDYLERSVIRLINYAVQKTGIVNVCAAGGVFMLDRILWFLTDIQREVYRLVKLVGHTQTEAADILGTSIPNINKHLKKAMERIEEQKEKM